MRRGRYEVGHKVHCPYRTEGCTCGKWRRDREAAPASPEAPVYRKVLENPTQPTPLFMIVCDEGWRESIVCQAMYEWAADWLLVVLGRRPYAPKHRPGNVASARAMAEDVFKETAAQAEEPTDAR